MLHVIHVTRYLVGERLPHVVIPALGPQHVAGQVSHGDLRVTRDIVTRDVLHCDT